MKSSNHNKQQQQQIDNYILVCGLIYNILTLCHHLLV